MENMINLQCPRPIHGYLDRAIMVKAASNVFSKVLVAV